LKDKRPVCRLNAGDSGFAGWPGSFGSMFATAAFVHSISIVHATVAFLDATGQFILFAFDELHRVVRKFRELLFQLALRNVPISACCETAHNF
jgi:hypothetical protein